MAAPSGLRLICQELTGQHRHRQGNETLLPPELVADGNDRERNEGEDQRRCEGGQRPEDVDGKELCALLKPFQACCDHRAPGTAADRGQPPVR